MVSTPICKVMCEALVKYLFASVRVLYDLVASGEGWCKGAEVIMARGGNIYLTRLFPQSASTVTCMDHAGWQGIFSRLPRA